MRESAGPQAIMTIELTMLALSIVLGLVHIVVQASSATMQHGLEWNAGPRDEPKPNIGVAGRHERALRNFIESFALFAAAVLIAHEANRHGTMTVVGVHLYFWGRLAYLPLYGMGVAYVRTLAWAVATLGIVLILLALMPM
jgi:uncharacterized MAPEG superfamily protein